MMRFFIVVLWSVLATSCGEVASPSVSLPTPPDEAFTRAARAAPYIFEGIVEAIGPSPGYWSGFVASSQSVTYRIVKIFADRDGRLASESQVTVQHPLVALSETADTEARLRPTLVTVGARVIVLALLERNRFAGFNEHHGIVAADEVHRAMLSGR